MSKNYTKIKIKESYDYESDVLCPFCSQRVLNMNGFEINPCKHTLFIAHDDSFVFCDERTKQNLNIPLKDDPFDYVENYDSGVDKMTSSISIPNSIKLANYIPEPLLSGERPKKFFGTYYGFIKD